MAKAQEITIQTLTAFTKVVEAQLGAAKTRHPSAAYTSNWYRGHGAATKYRLVPTLYRHPTERKLEMLLEIERRMLDDFWRQSVLHPPGPLQANRLGQLFYVQHYGVPTRLLDWTSNPFIALYFALTDDRRRSKGEGAAVWILDPVSWNEHALVDLAWKLRGPTLPEDKELTSYHPNPAQYTPADIMQMYEHPVATLGIANNARMFAQKGTFTIFGRRRESIEDIYEKKGFPKGCLCKLVIPSAKIGYILSSLTAIGYTDSVSYPDLHGLALELKRQNGFPA